MSENEGLFQITQYQSLSTHIHQANQQTVLFIASSPKSNLLKARVSRFFAASLISKGPSIIHHHRHALVTHQIPCFITNWIMSMLNNRHVQSNLSDSTVEKQVKNGCPQGGVISPLLWNLVIDELLNILNSTGIWCQAYADDVAICITAKDFTHSI